MSGSSEMVIFFLHFLLVAAFAKHGSGENECPERRCGHHGPVIRFPFWLRGQQPEDCEYPANPGFDLYCNDKNKTVLELPSSVKLLVKTINYVSQEIQVYDQDHCFPKQFPNLNISASPFQFIPRYSYDNNYYLRSYTTFNCSSNNLYPGQRQIPCLSSSLHGYNVYVFYSDSLIIDGPPFSCTKIFKFSSELSDLDLVYYPNYVLHLSWSKDSKPICRSCQVSRPPMAAVLTGVVLGFFLLVLVVFLLYRLHRSHKIDGENQAKIEIFLEDYKALKPTRYSFADIKRITNQFKVKLGQGGYGIVFKGKLSNEILVAVKILNDSVGNGEEFINEVRTMGTIHHVNVVHLVGFCADGFKRALVYEFLPNESLEKFIFSVDDKKHFLGWEKLQDIALGIAKGIEYLHQGCDQRILHFDIKPHNILLGHDFNPKICDFGLAKLCSKDQSAVSMTAVRGTVGYIAPEVVSRNFGNVSYKSDVYSFGILLLEMVGGRKNNDVRVENTSQVHFPEWIDNRLNESAELQIRIEEEGDTKIAKKLTTVGLWSIQWNPIDRPSMNVVVQMLEGDGEKLTMPPNPFTSTVQTIATATKFGRPFSGELAVIPESN